MVSTFKDKNMLLKCFEIVHLQRKEAILKPPQLDEEIQNNPHLQS
jgi:hypothetical protein